MEQFFKQALRAFLIVAAIAISVMNPFLWIPFGLVAGVGAGVFMMHLGDKANRETRAQRRERKREEKELSREQTSAKEMYYSKKEGWKVENLPYDMSPTIVGTKDENVAMTVAGMKGLVSANQSPDGTRFTLNLRDESQATSAERLAVEKRLGAVIRRTSDGHYVAVSANPHEISLLVKALNPAQDVKYEREVTHSRQYIVEGCKSFDEAVEKLKANPEKYSVANSFVNVKEGFGTNRTETMSGRPLDKATVVSLPTGVYVVTESMTTSDNALVHIPGDIRTEKDMRHFASQQFLSGAVERESVESKSYANGTPEGVTVSDSVKMGPELYTSTVDEIAAARLSAYVLADSPEQVASIVSGGELPAGTHVCLGVPPEDRLAVVVGIDDVKDVFKLRKFEGTDSVRESEYMTMAADIHRNGYSEVITAEPVSLSGASVRLANGATLAASEVGERVTNPRLDKLNSQELGNWMNDASQISRVDIEIDSTKATMRLTTQVGTQVKQEERPLTVDEMKSLQKRGFISKAELKDLVMQTHPDYYGTYRAPVIPGSSKVKSVYKDPVGDFISGKKPERSFGAALVMKNAKKKAEKNEVKRSGGMKPKI